MDFKFNVQVYQLPEEVVKSRGVKSRRSKTSLEVISLDHGRGDECLD